MTTLHTGVKRCELRAFARRKQFRFRPCILAVYEQQHYDRASDSYVHVHARACEH